jgi:serine/threonine kinase 38
MRQGRKKMTIREFEPLTIIGRGAFGEVRVCRQKSTGDIVAIKKMRKEDMLKKNQLMHVRTEREIMTSSNEWIVNLKYSFQDEYYLYLVMDFLPGGDLMNLLMKKEILTEDEARFYTAEMILAVDSVHKLNCIHRDLKPDNILIDKRGHIQLSDFGLSKLSDNAFYPMSSKEASQPPKKLMNQGKDIITKANPNMNFNNSIKLNKKFHKKSRLLAYSTVGTPDYIAPEVFGQNGYGQEVDWWSIGVMFFEMVVGYPPFFSENPSDTCKKIIKWKENFSIPEDAELSPEAENLILRMVAPAENRLGYGGVEEIMKHPFFKGVDWNNIRKTKAPFIPDIKNDYDTKYFDTFPEEEPFYPPTSGNNRQRKDVNYAGYTFNRDYENTKDSFLQALEVLEAVKKASEGKKEKEIITDESNFPQVNDKNNEILGEENKISHLSNNVKENKNHNQSQNQKINTNDNNYKSSIKINNHNIIDKKNLTINNQKERISTAPNKINYIKKNKEAKFNNNTITRNNAPMKKIAKSPDIPVKLSNTIQTTSIKVGHGVLTKKISPQARSNKNNKIPKEKLKINIENNNLKISNKKIVIKPGMRPCKTGESKIGKTPGFILNKNKK